MGKPTGEIDRVYTKEAARQALLRVSGFGLMGSGFGCRVWGARLRGSGAECRMQGVNSVGCRV